MKELEEQDLKKKHQARLEDASVWGGLEASRYERPARCSMVFFVSKHDDCYIIVATKKLQLGTGSQTVQVVKQETSPTMVGP